MLQVPTVFLSVSKAQTAPSAELAKAFGPDVRQDEIREEILRKGEVQVGERERKEISERVEREVLDIVSGRLVDPTTKRVYTPGMISKALDQLSSASGQQQQQQQQQQGEEGDSTEDKQRKPLWSGVAPNKSAKSQALEAMKALIAWQPIPVMRARMRLRVSCPVTLLKQTVKSGGNTNNGANNTANDEQQPSGGGGGSKGNKKKAKGTKKGKKGDVDDESDHEATPTGAGSGAGRAGAGAGAGAGTAPSNVKEKILSYIESVETQEVLGGDEWEVIGFADPGAFKGLNEFVGNETRGRGRVEVLDMTVTKDE